MKISKKHHKKLKIEIRHNFQKTYLKNNSKDLLHIQKHLNSPFQSSFSNLPNFAYFTSITLLLKLYLKFTLSATFLPLFFIVLLTQLSTQYIEQTLESIVKTYTFNGVAPVPDIVQAFTQADEHIANVHPDKQFFEQEVPQLLTVPSIMQPV